jgi:hypothetical protein
MDQRGCEQFGLLHDQRDGCFLLAGRVLVLGQ